MKKIRNGFLNSTKAQLTVMALCLILLFAYTVMEHLAKAPTEGWSREVVIDEVERGYIKSVESHIQAMPLDDGRALVVSVDGYVTKCITVNAVGEVVDEIALDLNLFEARSISLDPDGEILYLYYAYKGLYGVEIDLVNASYQERLLEEDVIDFEKEEDFFVLKKNDGLYVRRFDRYEPSDKGSKILDGSIKSYKIAVDRTDGSSIPDVYVMANVRKADRVDVHLIHARADELTEYQVVNDFTLHESMKDSKFDEVKGLVKAEGKEDAVLCIFQFTDNVYGNKYVTLQELSAIDGSVLLEKEERFEGRQSEYEILDYSDGTVTVVMRLYYDGGVNLAKVMIGMSDGLSVEPLTKTRKNSMFVGTFPLEGEDYLFFADMDDGYKRIQMVTTHDEVEASTTRLMNVEPLRVLLLLFVVIIQGAFMSAALYAVRVAGIPILLVLVLSRFLKRVKNGVYIQTAIGVLLHTILKVRFIGFIIHESGNYIQRPPILGNEPMVYVFAAGVCILLLIIVYGYIKRNRQYPSTSVYSYVLFVISDFAFFVLGFWMYTTVYLVIDKI